MNTPVCSLVFSLFLCAAAHGADAQLERSFNPEVPLEPPAINSHPGPEYADAVRPGNMILGLDRTPKGRLWAAWVGNRNSPNGF